MSGWIGMALYRAARGLLRLALGFYFSRVERFHGERVPDRGAVMFASNHPNSLTDAFVIGTSVRRKVNFVATVQLFRLKPLRWLLRQFGVIPINRVKDDARAMRTVLETFEACFRVLEQGEAVGIFPEGITHDDPQLKSVKTGTARMALELEHRHGGQLGLRIVPVGLNFSAKETYRSEVLVSFGEPIRASDFLSGYPGKRHACIQALNVEIERRIQALILHLPKLERARVVAAVKRLYLERLRLGQQVHEPISSRAEELALTQAIASAVDHVFETHPERAMEFVRRLDRYEQRLGRLRLSDEVLAQFPARPRLVWRTISWTVLGILGAPVAAYGWAHRWLPIRCVQWAVDRYGEAGRRRAGISTTAIVSGMVAFGGFYALCVGIVHALFGWPASLYYALSLPATGLLAHYYTRELRRFAAGFRATRVLLRAPLATRRLLAMRAGLVGEIEKERQAIALRLARQERKQQL